MASIWIIIKVKPGLGSAKNNKNPGEQHCISETTISQNARTVMISWHPTEGHMAYLKCTWPGPYTDRIWIHY
jgi:hypothetical protein